MPKVRPQLIFPLLWELNMINFPIPWSTQCLLSSHLLKRLHICARGRGCVPCSTLSYLIIIIGKSFERILHYSSLLEKKQRVFGIVLLRATHIWIRIFKLSCLCNRIWTLQVIIPLDGYGTRDARMPRRLVVSMSTVLATNCESAHSQDACSFFSSLSANIVDFVDATQLPLNASSFRNFIIQLNQSEIIDSVDGSSMLPSLRPHGLYETTLREKYGDRDLATNFLNSECVVVSLAKSSNHRLLLIFHFPLFSPSPSLILLSLSCLV